MRLFWIGVSKDEETTTLFLSNNSSAVESERVKVKIGKKTYTQILNEKMEDVPQDPNKIGVTYMIQLEGNVADDFEKGDFLEITPTEDLVAIGKKGKLYQALI